ncbi:hypothetical protein Y1Q_0002010 [Alligator mississippiensis]|uniref:Uncharacterized protein n=1 Tax=Alligator mississippiensis TaxID=8496 RepID=A0A151MNU6_ALLMI|nr:hypothetical protein Y1Q_0002010 [Alligator mississippiensis]
MLSSNSLWHSEPKERLIGLSGVGPTLQPIAEEQDVLPKRSVSGNDIVKARTKGTRVLIGWCSEKSQKFHLNSTCDRLHLSKALAIHNTSQFVNQYHLILGKNRARSSVLTVIKALAMA